MRFLLLAAALLPLGACAHMGETAAGAGASVAAPTLTAEQKAEGVDKLNGVAQQLIDAHKLYNDAGQLAKDGEFKTALYALATSRGKEASDVQGHVRELGGKPPTEPTVGPALADAWMHLKSVAMSDTKAAVQQVLAHEDAIISRLTDDLSDDKLAGSTKDYIHAIRDRVQADRERIANLKS